MQGYITVVMQDMHMWRGKLNAWLNKLVPSLFVLLLFLHQLLNCSLVRDSLVTEYIFTALIGANTSTNRYRHVDLDLLIYFRLTSSWGVINLPLNRHLTPWEVTWDTTLHRHSTRHKTYRRPVPFWSCTWREAGQHHLSKTAPGSTLRQLTHDVSHCQHS